MQKNSSATLDKTKYKIIKDQKDNLNSSNEIENSDKCLEIVEILRQQYIELFNIQGGIDKSVYKINRGNQN